MIIISIVDYNKMVQIETYLLKVCGFVWENKRQNEHLLFDHVESEIVFENNKGIRILINDNIMSWGYGFFYRNTDMGDKPLELLTDKDIFKNPEKCKKQLELHK